VPPTRHVDAGIKKTDGADTGDIVVAHHGGGIFASAVEAALIRSRGVRRVECRINSPGGALKDALSIFDMLRAGPFDFIHTIAEDVCASAATLILLAGDFRQAASHKSAFLLHRASISPPAGTLNQRWTSKKHQAYAARLGANRNGARSFRA
jgi:ATP-dependent protease ClpP protease subunit